MCGYYYVYIGNSANEIFTLIIVNKLIGEAGFGGMKEKAKIKL